MYIFYTQEPVELTEAPVTYTMAPQFVYNTTVVTNITYITNITNIVNTNNTNNANTTYVHGNITLTHALLGNVCVLLIFLSSGWIIT